MKQLLFATLILLLAACGSDREPTAVTTPTSSASVPTPSVPPDAGTIVAMGDSLTEGLGVDPAASYPAQLEQKLRAAGYAYSVINAGVSGETSTGSRARAEWVLTTLQPDILILATGGNDSLRALDPALTAENLDALVATFQAAGVTVILAGMQTVQNMGPEYTAAFRAIYPAVASEYDLIFVPFLLEGVAADPALNQDDFIHPNAAGYSIVAETLYPHVVQAIEAE